MLTFLRIYMNTIFCNLNTSLLSAILWIWIRFRYFFILNEYLRRWAFSVWNNITSEVKGATIKWGIIWISDGFSINCSHWYSFGGAPDMGFLVYWTNMSFWWRSKILPISWRWNKKKRFTSFRGFLFRLAYMWKGSTSMNWRHVKSKNMNYIFITKDVQRKVSDKILHFVLQIGHY